MSIQPQHILLISPEAWGKNLLSKHHYARFLAEKHRVWFLNPARGFTKIPFGNMRLTSQEISPGLTVISYLNILPRLNYLPAFLQRWVYTIQSRRILKFLKAQPSLVWSFDPRRFPNQGCWKAAKSIYHSVDLHPDSKEQELVKTSDLVIGLSDLICDDLRKYGTEPLRIGHGCHIDVSDQSKTVLAGTNTKKAIYTGNFHQHVDYNLLTRLASENKDVDFILIGPTEPSNISAAAIRQEDLKTLKEQTNVFLLGSLPGEELHKYLNAATICLVLFKKEYERIHHAPHKLMAYFASGNVILANPMEGYKTVPKDLMIQVSQEEIPTRFRELSADLAEHNSLEKSLQRKAFAASNHYRFKIDQILAKLFE